MCMQVAELYKTLHEELRSFDRVRKPRLIACADAFVAWLRAQGKRATDADTKGGARRV